MKRKSFASGFNFYKLVWVFLIFSVLGWCIEMLYAPIAHGHWESRNGLLYGPISQIYGIGAILMVVMLNRFATRDDGRAIPLTFLGGMAIGAIFEWAASWTEQIMFGTISWDYTAYWGSLAGGRINVLFTVFWGVLAVVIVKFVYPYISDWVERIPNEIGKPLTIAITVLLVLDIALTVMAVYRWQQRDAGVPPQNEIAVELDKHYPDSKMKKIFPNMKSAQDIDDPSKQTRIQKDADKAR